MDGTANSIECAEKHSTKAADKPQKDPGKVAIIISLGLSESDCDERDLCLDGECDDKPCKKEKKCKEEKDDD